MGRERDRERQRWRTARRKAVKLGWGFRRAQTNDSTICCLSQGCTARGHYGNVDLTERKVSSLAQGSDVR
jgi:hypothetical protein